MWRDLKGDTAVAPTIFVTPRLGTLDHVKMQAAAQKWVDSKYLENHQLPKDIIFDAFKECLYGAWDQGCKGCTTTAQRCHRIGSVRL